MNIINTSHKKHKNNQITKLKSYLTNEEILFTSIIKSYFNILVFLIINLKLNIMIYYNNDIIPKGINKINLHQEIINFSHSLIKSSIKQKSLYFSDNQSREFQVELMCFDSIIKGSLFFFSLYFPMFYIDKHCLTYVEISIVFIFLVVLIYSIVFLNLYKKTIEENYFNRLKLYYFISLLLSFIIFSYIKTFHEERIITAYRHIYLNYLLCFIILSYLNSSLNSLYNILFFLSSVIQISLIQIKISFGKTSISNKESMLFEMLTTIIFHYILQFLFSSNNRKDGKEGKGKETVQFSSPSKNSDSFSGLKGEDNDMLIKNPCIYNYSSSKTQAHNQKHESDILNNVSSINNIKDNKGKTSKALNKIENRKINLKKQVSKKSIITNPKLVLSSDNNDSYNNISLSDNLPTKRTPKVNKQSKPKYISLATGNRLNDNYDELNKSSCENSFENNYKDYESNILFTNELGGKPKDDTYISCISKFNQRYFSMTSKDIYFLNLLNKRPSTGNIKYRQLLISNVGILKFRLFNNNKQSAESVNKLIKTNITLYNTGLIDIFNDIGIVNEAVNYDKNKMHSSRMYYSSTLQSFDIQYFKSCQLNKVISIKLNEINKKKGVFAVVEHETLYDLLCNINSNNLPILGISNTNDLYAYRFSYVYNYKETILQVYINIDHVPISNQAQITDDTKNTFVVQSKYGEIHLTFHDITDIILIYNSDIPYLDFKNNLALGFTHDLKAGLTTVSQLAIELKTKQVIVSDLDTIKDLCDHMFYLVNSHLHLMRAIGKESQTVNLLLKKVDIRDILEFCFRILCVLIKTKSNGNVKPELRIDDEIDEYEIVSDEEKMKQVLINFISNAVKFTYKGKIELICNVNKKSSRTKLMNNSFTLSNKFNKEKNENRLSVNNLNMNKSDKDTSLNPDSTTIEIHVKDSGIGIDNDIVTKIINGEFNSLLVDLKNNPHGTGIGLNFSKTIISKLGYVFNIQSESNKGTDIRIIMSDNIKVKDENKCLLSPLLTNGKEKEKEVKNRVKKNVKYIRNNSRVIIYSNKKEKEETSKTSSPVLINFLRKKSFYSFDENIKKINSFKSVFKLIDNDSKKKNFIIESKPKQVSGEVDEDCSLTVKDKYLILIVDDDIVSLKHMTDKVKLLLNNYSNYLIINGNDGADLIFQIINDQNKNRLKCIITDESMKIINASKAIKFLKDIKNESGNKIVFPFIFCNSCHDNDYILEMGFDNIIKKDIKIKDLKELFIKYSIIDE